MTIEYKIHGIFPQITVGRDFREMTAETFIIISNEIVYSIFGKKYPGFPCRRLFLLNDNTFDEIEPLLAEIKTMDGPILGIGGGAVIDAAKYIAHETEKSLLVIPGATTTDAFLTPVSVVKNTRTKVEEVCRTKKPDRVYFDMDILEGAPARYNVAGLGDVISMYTAAYDWRLAHQQTGEPFDPLLAEMAMGLVKSLEPAAAEIAKNSQTGIKHIIDALMAEFFIYNLAGGNRPEVGSEHLFARLFEENHIGNFLHGEIVALGVLLMTYFQGRDFRWIKLLIGGLGINYKPQTLGIPPADLIRLTASLNRYVQERDLRYTVLNECVLTEQDVKQGLREVLGE
jgi:glycerol-1-phosphate dehydrogenase [NAD(P)+]